MINDPGIVRNRLKIQATINNTQRYLEVQQEFGTFESYLWPYVNGQPIVNEFQLLEGCPAKTPQSKPLAKD